jgi:hypothetical protein
MAASRNSKKIAEGVGNMRSILCCVCCVFVLSGFLLAQVGTQAAITGTVSDASGASVAGAHIIAVNLANGLSTQSESDPNGNFNILSLPAGSYRVTVEAQGFKKWESPQTQLTVGDRNRITAVLQIGGSAEVISVQGTSDAIQTEKATVETVIQMQQIRELPLADRNPLGLVGLVPGMRYLGTPNGMRTSQVQGQGLRDNKTQFQLDGLNSNDGSIEGGTAVPNVEAVAEFNVQPINAGAEAGRDPSQVIIITKAGTNSFHGSAFEFVQNDMFNAYNAFANKTQPKPHVRYNQFGGTLGGPIIKNKTFFFGSFQGTVIRNAVLKNEAGVPTPFLSGDFSSLSTPIIDPTTGDPFPGNIIPDDRISGASRYFLPLFVTPNSPDNRYIFASSAPDKTWEYLSRIDHQITDRQRIYGRYEYLRQPTIQIGYNADPSTFAPNTLHQHNFGANYTWTISNNTLFTATAGFLKTRDDYSNPALGKQNDSELAGIQGIPTTGREEWIGPPDISVNGYQGINFAGGWGVPGAQWNSQYNGKASLSHVHGAHIISAGFEYGDRHAFGGHGSASARGTFGFNGQYTGNGFADYLLGLTNSTNLNDALKTFGQDRAPYIGIYGTDTWKVRQNLTLELGLRYDRYLSQHCYLNLCSVWNPEDGKTVVAVDSNGNPNFSTFPTTAGLAAATAGLWETSTDAGYPRGLYEANGHWAPRLGMTYRPFAQKDFVLRAGYGLYYNIFTGNRGASEVNVPTWTVYGQTFGTGTLQNWETVWAGTLAAPNSFDVYSPLVDIKPTRTAQWNVSMQTAMPLKTSLTVSYVGTRVPNEIAGIENNIPTVGFHADLQADRPYPRFGVVHTFDNLGENWYHGLQTKAERRFDNGLAFTFSYSFSRTMADHLPDDEFSALLAFSPDSYNRHRASFDFRHIQSATVVWEVPYGRSRRFGSNVNSVVNTILGGWQLSGYETARSGQPLTMSNNNGNLGNGQSSRADLIGDPSISNPGKNAWFNTAAYAPAPQFAFGTSGIGDVEGPGFFQINSGLSKDFHISEARYFQFRWEAYNLFNNVNYDNPNQNVNDASNLGKIFSAQAARTMQFGLRFLF